MAFRKRASAIILAVIFAAIAAHAQAPDKRAITFHDLISMHRLSDPQISPDGRWVAYESCHSRSRRQ